MENRKPNPFTIDPTAKILLFISGIAAIILANTWRVTKYYDWWWWVLGVMVLVAAITEWKGRHIKKDHEMEVQAQRERALQNRIHESIRTNNIIPYYLYFRPFDSTGAILLPDLDPNSETNYLTEFGTADLQSLEVYLGRAVYPAEILGLGKKGETFGAARIEVSDEEWKKEATLLAKHAIGIFLIPSHHAGTKWELNLLKSNLDLLKKTIFLMPPRLLLGLRIKKNKQFNIQKEWELTREQLTTFNILLPAYHKKGLLFTLNNKGKVLKNYRVKNWSFIYDLKNAIRFLLSSTMAKA